MSTTTKIDWTTRDGRQAIVEVNFASSETINADGHLVEVPRCQLNICATVAGMTVGYGRPVPTGIDATPTAIGKLAMSFENGARVSAAIAAVEATSEWQAKLAAEESAKRGAAKYNAGRRQMRKVMGY